MDVYYGRIELEILSRSLWLTANRAARRATRIDRDEMVTAVVMAAAATEAFLHEVPQLIAINRAAPKYTPRGGDEAFLTLAARLVELQKRQEDVTRQYMTAAEILGRPFDPGANPLRDFQTLVSIRNDLVHPRLGDDDWKKKPAFNLPQMVIYWPPYIGELQARGLATDDSVTWRAALKARAVADWACETAESVIQAIAREFPSEFQPPGWEASIVYPMRECWVGR